MTEDIREDAPPPVTCSGGIRLGLRTAPAPAQQEAAGDDD